MVVPIIILGIAVALYAIIAEIVIRVKWHGCTYEVNAVVVKKETTDVDTSYWNEVTHSYDSGSVRTKVPVYIFVFNNQKYRVQGKTYVLARIKVGDTVKLYIDPSNPWHFYANNEKYTVLKWLLLIVGGGLTFIGIIYLISVTLY